MIGVDGFLGSNLVIDDTPQHVDEGKRIFRKINFSPKESDARTISLCVGDQLKGVVGCVKSSGIQTLRLSGDIPPEARRHRNWSAR